MGTPNREPQRYSGNMIAKYLPGPYTRLSLRNIDKVTMKRKPYLLLNTYDGSLNYVP